MFDRIIATLLCVIATGCIVVLLFMIYRTATSPSCTERGGRVVQTGTWLQPIPINNTILLIPQPIYACEGAKQ